MMSSAPYDLSISAARAGALFASPLQRSDEPIASQVRQAIAAAIGRALERAPDAGAAARERVLREFSLDARAAALHDLVERALGAR